MLTRPTTDILIADCCRELTEEILPALTDDTVRLRLVMTETVLRNAAVRAAHEIAWLLAETAALADFARQVEARHPTAEVRTALTALDAAADSLHLEDVAARYELASSAFTVALEQAQLNDAADLLTRAHEVLADRVRTEKEVMATYQVVGR